MQTSLTSLIVLVGFAVLIQSCGQSGLNNPYAEEDGKLSVLYQSFEERPKHLDPAVSYSSNEFVFISQIYEPPFQYHYLKRPYQLIPFAAAKMPDIRYLNQKGERLADNTEVSDIAYTDYLIDIKPSIQYQPHPALAKNDQGSYQYHHLSRQDIESLNTLSDFNHSGSRELIAEDYVYQIKRLAHPKVQSPLPKS